MPNPNQKELKLKSIGTPKSSRSEFVREAYPISALIPTGESGNLYIAPPPPPSVRSEYSEYLLRLLMRDHPCRKLNTMVYCGVDCHRSAVIRPIELVLMQTHNGYSFREQWVYAHVYAKNYTSNWLGFPKILTVLFFHTFRTNSMCKERLASFRYIRLNCIPLTFVVPNLLTIGANW